MAPYDHVKLSELAQAQGLTILPRLDRVHQLTVNDVPNYVTPASEQRAEQCLADGKSLKLIRKPTLLRTKGRLSLYEAKSIGAALPGLINANEDVGVIQALLNREAQLTKDASKTRDPTDDSLLLKAVDNNNTNLVWLLAPYTSLSGRNQALTAALIKRNADIIRKLLEYGADAEHCFEQFLAASVSADCFIVEHLLSASCPLQQETIIQALEPAVQTGSQRLLQRIVQAADLQSLQELQAVETAVKLGQADDLLILLLAASGLRSDYLDGLVLEAFGNASIDADSLVKILRALFYAGASGPKSSAAFRIAVERQSLKFVQVFSDHRIDVNWGAGRIVKSAVETGRPDLLQEVLRSASLSGNNASAAVTFLPQSLPPRIRHELLQILLQVGGHGEPFEKELILAVRNDDQNIVTLLRKNGVSVDNKRGDALIAAIQNENVGLLDHLLNGPVTQVSLQNALPYVRSAQRAARRSLTRLLLEAKVEGEVVDVALRDAIVDESSDYDHKLVNLLLQAGGDPNYDDARGLRHAILCQDSELFASLLASPAGVSEGVLSSLLSDIMAVKKRDARFRLMTCALAARPKSASVSLTLLEIFMEEQTDVTLLQQVARSGLADINFRDGVILTTGINADITVLEELLRMPNRSQLTTTTALVELLGLPTWDDEVKAARTALLLSAGRVSQAATEGLSHYIKYWMASKLEGDKWPLQTFQVLLNTGIEIISLSKVLPEVINAAAGPLLNLLLKLEWPVSVLDTALLEAAKAHRGSRVDLLRSLLDAHPSEKDISLALVHASRLSFERYCTLLLEYGASIEFENYVAIRHAGRYGNMKLLPVFLSRNLPMEAKEILFIEAKLITEFSNRFNAMQGILVAGIKRESLSDYLIDQVKVSAPRDMIKLLLYHQADVHHRENSCLIAASVANDLETLQILLRSGTKSSLAATQCFEQCILRGKIQHDQISLLTFLLESGAGGDSIDAALRLTVDGLVGQPDGLQFLETLLSHGADVDHKDGYVLCHASETLGPDIVAVLVKWNPTLRSRSRAMHHVLRSKVSKSKFCRVWNSLTGSDSSDEENADLQLVPGEFENPLKVLLSHRPDGSRELAQVLEYQSQILSQPGNNDILYWALGRKKPSIHGDLLSLLVTKGANIKYQEPRTGETILLQAIREQRSDLVGLLLKYGADNSITDNQGVSPLLLASKLGDTIATGVLLESGVRSDDGSLHHATRGLKDGVVQILLQHGHDPNRPSPEFQGRSALAELIFSSKATSQNQTIIQKIVRCLREHGADVQRPVSRKPLICWALDNKHDPLPMVQALLSAYLYKDIDAGFNLYSDGKFIYSPTMYVLKQKWTGPKQRADEIAAVLRDWGANRDVYYSMLGPQPDDAVGMPDEIAKIERDRRAKLSLRQEADEDLARRRRIEDEDYLRRRQMEEDEYERKKRREDEAFQRQISYRQRLEIEEQKLSKQKHDLGLKLADENEAAQQRRLESRHTRQLRWSEETARHEQKSISERTRLLRVGHEDELRHHKALGEQDLNITKEKMQLENANQRMSIAATQSALEAQVKTQQQLLSSQDHHQQRMHDRRMRQLTLEKAKPVGILSPSGGGFIEN